MSNRKNKGIMRFLPVLLVSVLVICVIVGGVMMLSGLNRELTIQLSHVNAVLEFGDALKGPEILVLLGNDEVEAQITVDQPEMTHLGSYTITYTAEYGKHTATAQFVVEVVDTTAPVITLMNDPDSKTLPGEKYIEEGYSAYDAFDGDLTDRVQRMVVDNVVYYKVTDSSGNVCQIERPIVYADVVAPELILLGNATIVVNEGESFEEPGYEATDDVDGDLTGAVIVSGEYDTSNAGTYTITYTVTDAGGNTAQVKRTLIVRGSGEITVVDPGEKIIYLTFDDGPSQYTLELLKVLEKYNVKATFFVVGTMSLEYLDEIAAGGHTIGLHSNSHDYESIYASDEAFMDDMMALREKVYERTGIYTNILRFPGGSSNTISKRLCEGIMTRLTETLTAQGYRIFDWNVDSKDAGGATTAEEVYENVINGVQKRPVSVVLQHDIRKFSVEAVEQIIIWGLENGYTFLSLDETSPVCQHTIAN